MLQQMQRNLETHQNPMNIVPLQNVKTKYLFPIT
jgi:hypothetical protein